MKYLLVRHAKTDANRMTRLAFGKEGAPINEVGRRQARSLGRKLRERGVHTHEVSVAVSELRRTKETAQQAGFKHLTINPLLNEVNSSDPQLTTALVAEAKLPPEAIAVAKEILKNPPKETIWITHGLVMAALLVELGLSDPAHFIPGNCEIREIEL